ncbi:MAG TPA: hypothetical protein VMU51_10735 [Mycobacteriales bacterium]|nr:hypothetical protein [Mycobacteriales bacterium]
MPFVAPLVDLVVTDDAQFERVAAWWLGAVRSLAPRLWQRQEDSPRLPLVERGGQVPEARLGPPGAAWADVSVIRRPWATSGFRFRTYSARNWAWLLDELRDRPVNASAAVKRLDDEGRNGGGGIRLQVQTADDEPDQVQVTGGGASDLDGGQYDEGFIGRWIALIEEVAGMAEPTFAVLGEEPSVGCTRLDLALRRTATESIGQAREVLRGFSWLTLCPAGLADKLGGPQKLKASGAFTTVTGLPHGAVLLQATDSLLDYGPHETHRVYYALRRVLPAVPPHMQGRDPR